MKLKVVIRVVVVLVLAAALFIGGMGLAAYLLLHRDEPTRQPRLADRSTYPVVSYATQDSGAILLHLNVGGKDRVFNIDSGASISTYDPKSWATSGAKPLQVDIFSQGLKLASVSLVDAKGAPVYDTTSIRPDGLLGEDFLKQVVLLFDPKTHKALLWPSKQIDAKAVLTGMPGAKKSWPTDGFLDLWPYAWTFFVADYDMDGRLYVKMQVGSCSLESALDTGCTSTGVMLRKLNQIEHWAYATNKGNFWSVRAVQRFFVVHDLVLPFTEAPIATIDEIFNVPPAEAWVGLDMINRGRWIMDTAHHEFGFQPYSDRSPTRVTMPQGDFLVNNDGSVEWAPSNQSSVTFPVVEINGVQPAVALGGLGSNRDRAGIAKSLAGAVSTLRSKPFTLTLEINGAHVDQQFDPVDLGKLPTVAEIAAARGKGK